MCLAVRSLIRNLLISQLDEDMIGETPKTSGHGCQSQVQKVAFASNFLRFFLRPNLSLLIVGEGVLSKEGSAFDDSFVEKKWGQLYEDIFVRSLTY